jgi:CRP/FNR family transcriptional regulator, anaerobic regulatory protein
LLLTLARRPADEAGVRPEDVDPCGQCGARPLGVCSDLDGSELQSMACASVAVEVAPGGALFREGEPNPHVFNVVSGALKLYRLLPDGRRQITGFLFKGDFLGLGARATASLTAEALTPVHACRFRRNEFERLLEAMPSLERRLVALAADELMAAQEQIVLLGRKTARERLASFLVSRRERQARLGEDADVVRLPMTRLDIADYLGLTVETVSRTVTQFKTTGLIRLRAVDAVEILKPEALSSLAEGLKA